MYIAFSSYSLLYVDFPFNIHKSGDVYTLQWRYNEYDGVSNHQPYDCLLTRLFRRKSKKTSKLRVTGLCGENSSVTGEFSAQKASNVENISIWWCHHMCQRPGLLIRIMLCCLFKFKQSPKPMLTFCQLDNWNKILRQLYLNTAIFCRGYTFQTVAAQVQAIFCRLQCVEYLLQYRLASWVKTNMPFIWINV